MTGESQVQADDSFTPVTIPDLGEAGSVWRCEKLKDFERQMRMLGLENEPEFKALQRKIEEYTVELEDLWEKQRNCEVKWWQDGEYDAQRADGCNDAGMEWYAAKNWPEAFASFSEAIRLHPRSAVYHSNRSMAALKMKQYDVALEDAMHSIEMDDMYCKGYIRAGKACLGLGDPERAKGYFQHALDMVPGSKAALAGLDDAHRMKEQFSEEDDFHQRLADEGGRPALSRDDVDVESVSLTLVSVEEILKSNPRLESAMYHKAECLVLIGRYKEALLFIDTLRSGVERSYILAEGLWRSGRVEDALEVLQEFVVRNEKCLDLKTYIERLQRDIDIIQRYMDEEGEYGQAVLRCSELLESLSMSACSGLYRRLLRMRADAHCCRGSWLDAKTDLNLALSIYEEDVDALRSKADVLKQMGAYTEYFLSLQRLKTVSPNVPGLSALIMDAARLSLKYKDGESMNYADTQTKTASGPAAAFDVLGVSHGVPLSDVRKAYLKLAATWHPDKWSSGTDDELKKAEETFKVIQKAYNDICDSMFL
ncbi:hypothetical protein M9435_000279 [Picochlorum sp. BPE23]|nr:hypothetical protein M9435_000279 [Picochlorum sp. BPE23]